LRSWVRAAPVRARDQSPACTPNLRACRTASVDDTSACARACPLTCHSALRRAASAHDAPAGAAPPHRLSSAQRRLGALLCNHKGFGVTDWCWRERIANVATSAPFFVLGARLACAPVAPPAARAYGASLLGVGVAALAYHTSAGTSRPHWRQLDYLSIGGASWVRRPAAARA
jgi:hypothetical protein